MNEQDIPIDIHSNKLLDWLTSRRHCNKEWHVNILQIREKINNAIQDMPAHEGIVKLLSGSHINYFHCLKIVDILKETEADSKNIFGRYGSQRMKDWQEIIQLYQRDNVYLAEAAQILIRNINYEVPSLRKQIAKLEQLQNECTKKAKDYAKSENIARSEFNASCKQLGIEGKQIKRELIDLLDELPKIYAEVAENFKSIKPSSELYTEFLKYNSSKDNSNIDCVPLLKYIIENGNTTTYEWTYGEKPVTIEMPSINITDDTTENTNQGAGDAIDFGDLSTNDGIDFGDGIDYGDISVQEGEIDWGNLDSTEVSNAPAAQEIDFNISLEESGIVVEQTGIDGGVAKGNDAYTLLDNPRTRNQTIDELLELESFLKMRLFEMSSENDLLSLSQMQDAPTILQMQTLESITSMLDAVEVVLNKLTNKRATHLHNIKHSPKYIDMLANTLKQKTTITEKMQASQKVVLQRAEEARKQAADIKPIIELIIEKTKQLQEQIQTEISKKYKNRIVNIVGGVNSL